MTPSKTPSSLNKQIYEEACEWLIAFRTGPVGTDSKKELDAWLRRSPELEPVLRASAAPTGRITARARESRRRRGAGVMRQTVTVRDAQEPGDVDKRGPPCVA